MHGRLYSIRTEEYSEVLETSKPETFDVQRLIILRLGLICPLFESLFFGDIWGILNNLANEFHHCLKNSCPIFVILVELLFYERMGRWVAIHEIRQFNDPLCIRMAVHESFQSGKHKRVIFPVDRKDTVDNFNSRGS